MKLHMYVFGSRNFNGRMQRNMIGVVRGNFTKWTEKQHETAQTIISANFAYCRSKVVKRFQWK